jgi:hypothetical protein
MGFLTNDLTRKGEPSIEYGVSAATAATTAAAAASASEHQGASAWAPPSARFYFSA